MKPSFESELYILSSYIQITFQTILKFYELLTVKNQSYHPYKKFNTNTVRLLSLRNNIILSFCHALVTTRFLTVNLNNERSSSDVVGPSSQRKQRSKVNAHSRTFQAPCYTQNKKNGLCSLALFGGQTYKCVVQTNNLSSERQLG